MIVNLLDRLISRCIELKKHSIEIKKNLFVEFVNPIYLDFETIHNEYLKSFKKYRSIIKSSDDFSTICDSLCENIEEDILFNATLRVKMLELTGSMDEDILDSFILHIKNYIFVPSDIVFGNEGIELDDGTILITNQVYRNNLIEELKEINEKYNSNEKKMNALIELDKIVIKMQENYALVTSCYAKLKQKLLL
jgi:hypothetical protein